VRSPMRSRSSSPISKSHATDIAGRDRMKSSMGRLSCPMGALSFRLTGLEGQCHFCDAAGDVKTLAAFDAERLQRD
jgi:hypothetical protein